MISPLRFLRRALFFFSFLAATSSVFAGVPRPFESRVVATWDNVFYALPEFQHPDGAQFLGYGLTTHMGRAAQNGDLFLLSNTPDAMGEIPGVGSVTLTASNGDTLTFDYLGSLNVVTGVGTGIFIFTGGTGRFAGATGGGTFHAVIDLSQPTNQAMTVDLDGTVNY